MNASVLNRLKPCGSGPLRLRDSLRRQTRHVRTCLSRADVSRVATRLPHGVFGGDLLDLLSDSLRQVIQYDPTRSVSEPVRTLRPAKFASGSEVSARQTSFAQPPQQDRPALAGLTQPQSRTTERDVYTSMRQDILAQISWRSAAEEPETALANAILPLPLFVGEPLFAASDNWRVRRYPAALSLLEQHIETYWQLDETERRRTHALENPHNGIAAARNRRTPEHVISSVPAQSLPANENHLAEALQRFVSGVRQNVKLGEPNEWRASHDTSMQAQFAPAIAEQPSLDEIGLDDLFDRLTERLRQQVMDYGIDIP